MKIKIGKEYSGLRKSFEYEINEINNSVISYDHILELNNLTQKKLNIICKNLLNELSINSEEVIWNRILNKNIIETRKKEIINNLKNINSEDIKYLNIFSSRINLINSLRNNIIDNKIIEVPEYKLNGTVTGRMTIKSGLNYLTMKAEDKNKFQSQFKDGKILEIDLKSLEPFLYFKIIKGKDYDDVYNNLNEDLFNNKLERKKCKLAIISALYGASINKISKVSGMNYDEAKSLKEFLEYESVQEKLQSEFNDKGFFRNYYGRKIFKSNAFVNHYIQSTAADYCFYIYNNLIQSLDSKYFRPIATIHDALIIDCHPAHAQNILNRKYLSEDIINSKPQISVKILNEKKN